MSLAAGALGGATTMLMRTATRKAMHGRGGAPRLPAGMRRRRGIGAVLAWAAAAGVLLALADLLVEQRASSGSDPSEA